MTNDEFPMTNQIRIPKSEWEARVPYVIIRSFELRHSFDISHSGFVIFQSHDSNAKCGIKQLTTDH